MVRRRGAYPWSFAVPAVLLGACSTIATQPDGGPGADGAAVDAPAPDGATPDVPHIGPGGDASRDALASDASRDAPAPADAAPPTDAPAPVDAPVDTGPSCDSTCPAHAHCLEGVCQCDPFFVGQGASCVPMDPGDPATRTDAELCNQLQANWPGGGRFVPGTGGTCDPGSLDRGALDDALAALNLYRWLVGLSPADDDPDCNARDQQCAMMESMNGQPNGTFDPHHPSSNWACYTPEGAGAAGTSNIAWGVGSAADSIGLYIADPHNEATMGHRRWVLNTTLGSVGIGYYSSASCLGVFGCYADTGFSPVSPPWHAYPPPGPAPLWTTYGVWTFHANAYAIDSSTTATVTRASDGASLPVTVTHLPGGYGDSTLSWQANGWSAAVGETYHVDITGLSVGGSSVSYDVRVIDCP